MKLSSCFFTIIVIVALLAVSCNVAYVPNKHNVPLMQEKGDLSVSLSTSNVQGAYAISNSLAVMGNAYFRDNDWETTPVDTALTKPVKYQANRLLAEAGLGYYRPLGDNAVFETYGGAGIGSIHFENNNEYFQAGASRKGALYKARMGKAFIQPQIGYKSDYVDVIFSTRISALTFDNVDTSGLSLAQLKADNLYNLDRQPFFFMEPAITIQLGYKFVKLYTQAVVVRKINPQPISYQTLGINMGLQIDINRMFQSLSSEE